MDIDRKYIKESILITDNQKQTNFHNRFLEWLKKVNELNIKDNVDAIDKVDKIKGIYRWVETYEFIYYYKHLTQKTSSLDIVIPVSENICDTCVNKGVPCKYAGSGRIKVNTSNFKVVKCYYYKAQK